MNRSTMFPVSELSNVRRNSSTISVLIYSSFSHFCVVISIECLQSRDQRPYLFNETSERFCVTEEFKSLRIDLGHRPQTWPTFHFLGTATWQL